MTPACEAMLLSLSSYRYVPTPERWPTDRPFATHEAESISRVFQLKRSSVFCLEPPGASPGRQSIVNSLLSACIPVFVADGEMSAHFDHLWPHHFVWRSNASVLYTAESLQSGATSFESIHAHLAELNASGAVARMQAIIEANAHRLVYGLDHGRYTDDDRLAVRCETGRPRDRRTACCS